MKNQDFGKFLSNLLNKQNEAVSSAAVEALKQKMQQEKALLIENKLRSVASQINAMVSEIRKCRRREKEYQDAISKLEEKANAIIAGKDEDDN